MSETPELKGIYRYQIDVVVFADSQKEADDKITFKQPGFVRSVTWTTIREPHGWVNPAWRVMQEGDVVTVEPKRGRRPALPQKKRRLSGAPLGPDDPGFSGNAAEPVSVEPNMDTSGRSLPPTGEPE